MKYEWLCLPIVRFWMFKHIYVCLEFKEFSTQALQKVMSTKLSSFTFLATPPARWTTNAKIIEDQRPKCIAKYE